MPNRSQRRHAEREGVELPIIDIRLFSTGQVVIDKHGDITDDQIEGFVQQVLVNIQTKNLIRD